MQAPNWLKRIDTAWTGAIVPRMGPAFEALQNAFLFALILIVLVGVPSLTGDPEWQAKVAAATTLTDRFVMGLGTLLGVFIGSLAWFIGMFIALAAVALMLLFTDWLADKLNRQRRPVLPQLSPERLLHVPPARPRPRIIELYLKFDRAWMAIIARLAPFLKVLRTCYMVVLMGFVVIGMPTLSVDPAWQKYAAEIHSWERILGVGLAILMGLFPLAVMLAISISFFIGLFVWSDMTLQPPADRPGGGGGDIEWPENEIPKTTGREFPITRATATIAHPANGGGRGGSIR